MSKSLALKRVEELKKEASKKSRKEVKKAPRAIFKLPAPDYNEELKKALPAVLPFVKQLKEGTSIEEQLLQASSFGVYDSFSLLVAVATLQTEKQELQTEKQELEAEKQELQTEKQELEAENKKLQTEIKSLKSKSK